LAPILAALLALAVGVFVTPPAAGAQTTNVKAFMTLYGWADNSPPGPGIAHTTCLHRSAGGTGTYANPITFATDVSELGWCTIIYVPYMKRYFIHEDECSQCDRDWTTQHLYRFDMWAGGNAQSLEQPEHKALLQCESTWTRADSIDDPDNPTVMVNPPDNLPVTPAPIFTAPTTCWNGTPIAITNPGKQSTVIGAAVNVKVRAVDYSGRTPRFAARGLPPGLDINTTTGTVSGRPTVKGHDASTVTVSDGVNAASIAIAWKVAAG
jgi:Putative Ig domain